MNFCSTDVPKLDAFYRDVLGLEPEPSLNATRVMTAEGYAGKVAFVTDGAAQLHLAERDLGVGFRTNNAINPLERGHIAFRADDIEAFKRHLKEKGIPFSDYGGCGHEHLAPDLLPRPRTGTWWRSTTEPIGGAVG